MQIKIGIRQIRQIRWIRWTRRIRRIRQIRQVRRIHRMNPCPYQPNPCFKDSLKYETRVLIKLFL